MLVSGVIFGWVFPLIAWISGQDISAGKQSLFGQLKAVIAFDVNRSKEVLQTAIKDAWDFLFVGPLLVSGHEAVGRDRTDLSRCITLFPQSFL